MPPDLEAEISALAEQHDRSENAEIIHILRTYVKSQKVCCMCDQHADLECKVGPCAPSKWYCAWHYGEEHKPLEDE